MERLFLEAALVGDAVAFFEAASRGSMCAIRDPPSSRVSSVVNILGDFSALEASFLILGEVSGDGAFGIYILQIEESSSKREKAGRGWGGNGSGCALMSVSSEAG